MFELVEKSKVEGRRCFRLSIFNLQPTETSAGLRLIHIGFSFG